MKAGALAAILDPEENELILGMAKLDGAWISEGILSTATTSARTVLKRVWHALSVSLKVSWAFSCHHLHPESFFSKTAQSLSYQCSKKAKSAKNQHPLRLMTFGSWCINAPAPLPLWDNCEVCILCCFPGFPIVLNFSYPQW